MNYTEQVNAALNQYAAIKGKGWKDALRLAWYNGNYKCDRVLASELQAVRNHPQFGHEYLANFK